MIRTPMPYRAPVVDPETGGTADEYGQTVLADPVTILCRARPKLRVVLSNGQQVQSETKLITRLKPASKIDTPPPDIREGGVFTFLGRDWPVLAAGPVYAPDGVTVLYWDVAL